MTTTCSCPACTIAADLTAHRDATAPEWSSRRATLNFAAIVAKRACPGYAAAADQTEPRRLG